MKWVVRSSFLLEQLEAKKLLPKKFDGENLKAQITAAVDFAVKDGAWDPMTGIDTS